MLSTILIIILLVAVIGALPIHSYSRSWSYGPMSIIGFILLVIVILALVGRL